MLPSLCLLTVGVTTWVAEGDTITDVVGAGESAVTISTDESEKEAQMFDTERNKSQSDTNLLFMHRNT